MLKDRNDKLFVKNIITLIEDLANEIFFEIFEYLESCDMFKAFSNLNFRFSNLLNHSSFLFNIKLCSESQSSAQDYCTYDIIQNKHRIISLEIINYQSNNLLYKLFTIDASFIRLETLTIRNTSLDKIETILNGLYVLPRLFSLIIYHYSKSKDFINLYSTILGLPELKYCRICLDSCNKNLALPMVANEQATSSIKDFIIRHSLTIEELISLISYTPSLHRLVCKELFKSEEYINKKGISITLLNLTNISIGCCHMTFDDFEIFIRQIPTRLQVLRLSTIEDLAYLDADRWEDLISTYLPYLYIFDFQYRESIDDNLKMTEYHKLINHFQSSFWIQRKWFFEIKIDDLIIYSINSSKYEFFLSSIKCIFLIFKRKFYQFFNHSISETIQLTLMNLSFIKNINIISPILLITQINRLVINCEISINMLSQFIYRLPHLTSLILQSLETDFKLINKENVRNKIKNVCLKNLITFEQIDSIIELCSLMDYLEILDINHLDLQILFHLIITKYGKNIRHHFILCLIDYQVTDNVIQQIINTEIQDNNCMIRYAYGNIYLECKY